MSSAGDSARVANMIRQCKEKGLIIGKNGDTVAGFNIFSLYLPFYDTCGNFFNIS